MEEAEKAAAAGRGSGGQNFNEPSGDQDMGQSALDTNPTPPSTDGFDVFLCHNSQDKAAVEGIARTLRERGLRPWLDKWELRPGGIWQRALEEQIEKIDAAAVFVGSNGIGPWQQLEQEAFLRQFVERRCPVIPVLLPGLAEKPKLPPFLAGFMWVDFNVTDPDPVDQLIWGITGEKPSS